jgi:hypothetical protein
MAQSVFAVTAFRPGQRELIEAVLGGRDAFDILRTWGGKSLVVQLASLFPEKPVVVAYLGLRSSTPAEGAEVLCCFGETPPRSGQW